MNIRTIILAISIISCSPQETITAESAKADTIKLLNDLKINYKGVHCILNHSQLATCEISTNGEMMKSKCELHNCKLIEKNALRIKFGITK